MPWGVSLPFCLVQGSKLCSPFSHFPPFLSRLTCFGLEISPSRVDFRSWKEKTAYVTPPQAEWAWSGEGQRGQSSGGELASPSHAGKSLSCPALSAMAPGWAHCVPSHCWHCHRMGNSTGRATHPLLIVDPPLVVLPHHHLDAAFPVVSLQHDSLGGRTGGHG